MDDPPGNGEFDEANTTLHPSRTVGRALTVTGRSAHEKGEPVGSPFRIRMLLAAYLRSVGSEPSVGAPVPDEPMNSFLPSGNVTSRPLALQAGRQSLSLDW